MDNDVRGLFERYARTFDRGLQGEDVAAETAEYFAPQFIASVPSGVYTGANGDPLREAVTGGFERYRALGTRAMLLGDIRVVPIDERHVLAFVSWTATYEKDDAVIGIPFTNCYFLRVDERLRIFGWVVGDEEAALREHGIV